MVAHCFVRDQLFVQMVQTSHNVERAHLEDIAFGVAVKAVDFTRILLRELLSYPFAKFIVVAWESIMAFVKVR